MDVRSKYWVGIDLGSYNSSAAIMSEQGTIEIIRSLGEKFKSKNPSLDQQERCKEFPSFISFNQDGTILDIGMPGKERALTDPEYVVWGIKRLLGKTYTELKESGELDRFPYRIRPDRNNGHCIVAIGNKSYTPIALCAEIFKKIKCDAEKQIGKDIDSLVVSVPAYFDPIRVTPIVEAARLANFTFIKTIPEPVAAALAYNVDITVKPLKVMVFDLGAGTLDVTAGYLCRHPEHANEFLFQVMKNTGDTRLGGIDMDDRLMHLIMEKCRIADPTQSEMASLRRTAEIAKIKLSESQWTEEAFHVNGKEFKFLLDQLDLKSALEGKAGEKNLLEECRRQLMSAIEEAGWTPQEVELLLIVGGPTKLPCIYEILKIVFNSNPLVLQQIEEFYKGNEKVDRMNAVSIGAAKSVSHHVDDRVPTGHGIEDVEIGDEHITYRPNILVPRDNGYPFRSKPYVIPWITVNGLLEFKIIQQVPKSEIEQSGHEYRFVGLQKFAVKNPQFCLVVLQMGYTENKELEVIITNAFSPEESVTYVGMNQTTSIGINYPMKVRRPPLINPAETEKLPPPTDVLDRFMQLVQVNLNFIQKKVHNYPIPQMLISQQLDEIGLYFRRGDAAIEYETVYTKINSLIWNSNSRGLLDHDEYRRLTECLGKFEADLFKYKRKQG